MASTFLSLHYHLVFSTKNRDPANSPTKILVDTILPNWGDARQFLPI